MKKRVLILADANSPHTHKWVNQLADCGWEVGLFSLNQSDLSWVKSATITCLYQSNALATGSILSKIKYLFFLPRLYYCQFKFKPQLVHAHYASSYGLMGALCPGENFYLSAWGSDLITFPLKSFLHKWIIRFVLFRAKKITAPSSFLKKKVVDYCAKPVDVIPFAIDLSVFKTQSSTLNTSVFTFGCIKHLEPVYNIDKVIKAFYLLLGLERNTQIKLIIIGNGSMKAELHALVNALKISEHVVFKGAVSNHEIPGEMSGLNALVNISEYESFGVVIAEAMACEVPVIVSNTPGFKDLVPDENYGFITRSNSLTDTLYEMRDCMTNDSKRKEITQNCINHIKTNFSVEKFRTQVARFYGSIL